MIRKIKIFFSFFLLQSVVASLSFAQVSSLSPYLIGSTGNFSTVGGMSISSSVGEPITATVTTGTLTLTQGFQQSDMACPTFSSFTVTPSTTICAGTNVTITPILSGGAQPYDYIWSTGETTTSITVAPTINTAYTFSIVGCPTTGTASITVNSLPALTMTPPSVTVCAGTTTTLSASASGSVSYVWSPGGATTNVISITPSTAANYTVLVTDLSSGCSDTGLVAVSVNPTPTVAIAGITSICSGQSTTLTANASIGVTSYSWIPANINSTISVGPLVSNTGYTVTVSDASNCTAMDTVTVIVSPGPSASVTAVPNIVCTGGTSTLTASGGGTYVWNPGGSTATSLVTAALTSPANYTVTVSNGSCTDTAMITVGVTNFSAGISITNNDSVLCAGETALLTATTGNAYLWSTGETTQSISITPTNTATYFVSVTAAGGCTAADSMLITVTSAPVASITANVDTVCRFSTVTLTASGGTTYQWDGGPATAVYNATPTMLGNNTYSVTVSNGTCSSGATYVIFAKALPTITSSANPGAICAGDTAILSASGGATYVWSTGALTASISVAPVTSTTYTVVGTDANSCSDFSTVTVTLNTISVDAGPNMTICPGFTADLNATVTGIISGVTYSWSPANLLNDPAAQNPSANPEDSATQFVVTVTNGSCTSSDSLTVYAIRTPACVIHVYNGITPNGDNDNNSWHIDGIQAYPENSVIIFNRWGTRVWGAKGYNNKDILWKGTDQQGNILPAGTYYYLVELYDEQGGTVFSESSWVEVTH